jgi:hypothetical protein
VRQGLPWYRRGRELNKMLLNEHGIETSLWSIGPHRLASRSWGESMDIPEISQLVILIP